MGYGNVAVGYEYSCRYSLFQIADTVVCATAVIRTVLLTRRSGGYYAKENIHE